MSVTGRQLRGLLLVVVGGIAACTMGQVSGEDTTPPGADAGAELGVDADAPEESPSASHIIYLQGKGGVTYSPGTSYDSAANTSPLLSEPITPAASEFYPDQWRDLVSCVADKLSPFDIEVTDEDPGNVEHTEIVVSGNQYYEYGFPASNFAGPTGCAAEPRSLIFAYIFYNDEYMEYRCDSIAYAIGISIGLDSVQQIDAHTDMDAMNFGYHGRCEFGGKEFRDADLACGVEWQSEGPCSYELEQVNPCRCGGDTQNSFGRMVEVYGLAK